MNPSTRTTVSVARTLNRPRSPSLNRVHTPIRSSVTDVNMYKVDHVSATPRPNPTPLSPKLHTLQRKASVTNISQRTASSLQGVSSKAYNTTRNVPQIPEDVISTTTKIRPVISSTTFPTLPDSTNNNITSSQSIPATARKVLIPPTKSIKERYRSPLLTHRPVRDVEAPMGSCLADFELLPIDSEDTVAVMACAQHNAARLALYNDRIASAEAAAEVATNVPLVAEADAASAAAASTETAMEQAQVQREANAAAEVAMEGAFNAAASVSVPGHTSGASRVAVTSCEAGPATTDTPAKGSPLSPMPPDFPLMQHPLHEYLRTVLDSDATATDAYMRLFSLLEAAIVRAHDPSAQVRHRIATLDEPSLLEVLGPREAELFLKRFAVYSRGKYSCLPRPYELSTQDRLRASTRVPGKVIALGMVEEVQWLHRAVGLPQPPEMWLSARALEQVAMPPLDDLLERVRKHRAEVAAFHQQQANRRLYTLVCAAALLALGVGIAVKLKHAQEEGAAADDAHVAAVLAGEIPAELEAFARAVEERTAAEEQAAAEQLAPLMALVAASEAAAAAEEEEVRAVAQARGWWRWLMDLVGLAPATTATTATTEAVDDPADSADDRVVPVRGATATVDSAAGTVVEVELGGSLVTDVAEERATQKKLSLLFRHVPAAQMTFEESFAAAGEHSAAETERSDTKGAMDASADAGASSTVEDSWTITVPLRRPRKKAAPAHALPAADATDSAESATHASAESAKDAEDAAARAASEDVDVERDGESGLALQINLRALLKSLLFLFVDMDPAEVQDAQAEAAAAALAASATADTVDVARVLAAGRAQLEERIALERATRLEEAQLRAEGGVAALAQRRRQLALLHREQRRVFLRELERRGVLDLVALEQGQLISPAGQDLDEDSARAAVAEALRVAQQDTAREPACEPALVRSAGVGAAQDVLPAACDSADYSSPIDPLVELRLALVEEMAERRQRRVKQRQLGSDDAPEHALRSAHKKLAYLSYGVPAAQMVDRGTEHGVACVEDEQVWGKVAVLLGDEDGRAVGGVSVSAAAAIAAETEEAEAEAGAGEAKTLTISGGSGGASASGVGTVVDKWLRAMGLLVPARPRLLGELEESVWAEDSMPETMAALTLALGASDEDQDQGEGEGNGAELLERECAGPVPVPAAGSHAPEEEEGTSEWMDVPYAAISDLELLSAVDVVLLHPHALAPLLQPRQAYYRTREGLVVVVDLPPLGAAASLPRVRRVDAQRLGRYVTQHASQVRAAQRTVQELNELPTQVRSETLGALDVPVAHPVAPPGLEGVRKYLADPDLILQLFAGAQPPDATAAPLAGPPAAHTQPTGDPSAAPLTTAPTTTSAQAAVEAAGDQLPQMSPLSQLLLCPLHSLQALLANTFKRTGTSSAVAGVVPAFVPADVDVSFADTHVAEAHAPAQPATQPAPSATTSAAAEAAAIYARAQADAAVALAGLLALDAEVAADATFGMGDTDTGLGDAHTAAPAGASSLLPIGSTAPATIAAADALADLLDVELGALFPGTEVPQQRSSSISPAKDDALDAIRDADRLTATHLNPAAATGVPHPTSSTRTLDASSGPAADTPGTAAARPLSGPSPACAGADACPMPCTPPTTSTVTPILARVRGRLATWFPTVQHQFRQWRMRRHQDRKRAQRVELARQLRAMGVDISVLRDYDVFVAEDGTVTLTDDIDSLLAAQHAGADVSNVSTEPAELRSTHFPTLLNPEGGPTGAVGPVPVSASVVHGGATDAAVDESVFELSLDAELYAVLLLLRKAIATLDDSGAVVVDDQGRRVAVDLRHRRFVVDARPPAQSVDLAILTPATPAAHPPPSIPAALYAPGCHHSLADVEESSARALRGAELPASPTREYTMAVPLSAVVRTLQRHDTIKRVRSEAQEQTQLAVQRLVLRMLLQQRAQAIAASSGSHASPLTRVASPSLSTLNAAVAAALTHPALQPESLLTEGVFVALAPSAGGAAGRAEVTLRPVALCVDPRSAAQRARRRSMTLAQRKRRGDYMHYRAFFDDRRGGQTREQWLRRVAMDRAREDRFLHAYASAASVFVPFSQAYKHPGYDPAHPRPLPDAGDASVWAQFHRHWRRATSPALHPWLVGARERVLLPSYFLELPNGKVVLNPRIPPVLWRPVASHGDVMYPVNLNIDRLNLAGIAEQVLGWIDELTNKGVFESTKPEHLRFLQHARDRLMRMGLPQHLVGKLQRVFVHNATYQLYASVAAQLGMDPEELLASAEELGVLLPGFDVLQQAREADLMLAVERERRLRGEEAARRFLRAHGVASDAEAAASEEASDEDEDEDEDEEADVHDALGHTIRSLYMLRVGAMLDLLDTPHEQSCAIFAATQEEGMYFWKRPKFRTKLVALRESAPRMARQVGLRALQRAHRWLNGARHTLVERAPWLAQLLGLQRSPASSPLTSTPTSMLSEASISGAAKPHLQPQDKLPAGGSPLRFPVLARGSSVASLPTPRLHVDVLDPLEEEDEAPGPLGKPLSRCELASASEAESSPAEYDGPLTEGPDPEHSTEDEVERGTANGTMSLARRSKPNSQAAHTRGKKSIKGQGKGGNSRVGKRGVKSNKAARKRAHELAPVGTPALQTHVALRRFGMRVQWVDGERLTVAARKYAPAGKHKKPKRTEDVDFRMEDGMLLLNLHLRHSTIARVTGITEAELRERQARGEDVQASIAHMLFCLGMVDLKVSHAAAGADSSLDVLLMSYATQGEGDEHAADGESEEQEDLNDGGAPAGFHGEVSALLAEWNTLEGGMDHLVWRDLQDSVRGPPPLVMGDVADDMADADYARYDYNTGLKNLSGSYSPRSAPLSVRGCPSRAASPSATPTAAAARTTPHLAPRFATGDHLTVGSDDEDDAFVPHLPSLALSSLSAGARAPQRGDVTASNTPTNKDMAETPSRKMFFRESHASSPGGEVAVTDTPHRGSLRTLKRRG